MLDRRGAAAGAIGNSDHRTTGSTTPATRTRTRMSGSKECTEALETLNLHRRVMENCNPDPARDHGPYGAVAPLRTAERARYHERSHGTPHILRPRHRPAGPHVVDDVPAGPRL